MNTVDEMNTIVALPKMNPSLEVQIAQWSLPDQQKFLTHVRSALFDWINSKPHGSDCSCCGAKGSGAALSEMVGLELAKAWNVASRNNPGVFGNLAQVLGVRIFLKEVPPTPDRSRQTFEVHADATVVDALMASEYLAHFESKQEAKIRLNIQNGLIFVDDTLVTANQDVKTGQTLSVRYDYPYPHHRVHPRMPFAEGMTENDFVRCVEAARNARASDQERLSAMLNALSCCSDMSFRGDVCFRCTCMPGIEAIYERDNELIGELLISIRAMLQKVTDQ